MSVDDKPPQLICNFRFVDEWAVPETDMEDIGRHPHQRKKTRHHHHTDGKQG